MRKNWRNKLSIFNCQFSIFVVLVFLIAACSNDKHADHADTYTCPMHPTVVSDRPSTCPVCGMDLVRKARPGEEVEITPELARLIKSPNEMVIASIKTTKCEFKSMPVKLNADGVVTYDTRYTYAIPARMGGRLEKVYIKYPFQSVKKGQKVADIYSPELLTAQRELLYLIENDGSNSAMIDAAKNKLYLLGASAQQLEKLVSTKAPQTNFSIYSPYDGYVISEGQQAPVAVVSSPTPSSSGMSSGMGGSISSTPASQPMNTSNEFVREGTYVTSGQVLFKIVNALAMRVELNLSASQAKQVSMGNEADLLLENQSTQKGKVDFIQPFFNDGQEFITVRIYVKDGDRLQVGQLVKATLESTAIEALWIPKEAVLDLGTEKVVFVKEREMFKPKTITTGVESNGWIEIKSGLSSSDEIAVNAQYLIDSESFVKTK